MDDNAENDSHVDYIDVSSLNKYMNINTYKV